MKSRTVKTKHKTYRSAAPAYPNQADGTYYAARMLDVATGLASGIGLFFSILCFAAIM